MDINDVLTQDDRLDMIESIQSPSEDLGKTEVKNLSVNQFSFPDLLYSFLCDRIHKELRIINKYWNMKVGGNKNVLVARAMVKGMILSQSGSLENICKQNKGFENIDEFRKQNESRPELQFNAPALDCLFQKLPAVEQTIMRRAWYRSKKEYRGSTDFNRPDSRHDVVQR